MAKLIVRSPQKAKLKTTGFISQPEGDITLSENNKTTNVSSFATATVRVPEPTGTLLITENGEQINIKDKEFVDVAVPLPSGEITLDKNNQAYDVTEYAIANVAIPEEEKTVKPSNVQQVITPDNGFLRKVTVEPTPLEERTVILTTEQQIITPQAPSIGISKATISPVTAQIDANIQPENIKQGVNILGVDGALKQPTLITKQITENGTYTAADDNADGFREVEVSVIDRKFVDLVQRTATRISNSDALTIGNNAFYSYSTLESVNFDNVIDIGALAFQSCGSLKTIEFQNLQNIGFAAFRYCSALTTANFPSVVSIATAAFQSSGLQTLILHKRASLSNVNAFYGIKEYTVYVENSDIEWYSTATNWSAIYTDGHIKSIDELPPTGGTI